MKHIWIGSLYRWNYSNGFLFACRTRRKNTDIRFAFHFFFNAKTFFIGFLTSSPVAIKIDCEDWRLTYSRTRKDFHSNRLLSRWKKINKDCIRSLAKSKTACWKYTFKSNWMTTDFLLYHFSNSNICCYRLHSFGVLILHSLTRYDTPHASIFVCSTHENWDEKRRKNRYEVMLGKWFASLAHLAMRCTHKIQYIIFMFHGNFMLCRRNSSRRNDVTDYVGK